MTILISSNDFYIITALLLSSTSLPNLDTIYDRFLLYSEYETLGYPNAELFNRVEVVSSFSFKFLVRELCLSEIFLIIYLFKQPKYPDNKIIIIYTKIIPPNIILFHSLHSQKCCIFLYAASNYIIHK